jgi:hypothetical protein
MHVDERDEVALAVQQWRWQKPRRIGDLWLFVVAHSVAVACIYREDPPRVTASHNRLGLSLSKRIRHRLIAKINVKQSRGPVRLWAGFQWTIRTHVVCPCPSPRHTTPGPTQRGEVSGRVCVFLHFSSPPYSCKWI